MVPRLTSAKVTEAPAAQDPEALPESQPDSSVPEPRAPESSTGEGSQAAARDGAAGARPFRSEKVIAADIARDLIQRQITGAQLGGGLSHADVTQDLHWRVAEGR